MNKILSINHIYVTKDPVIYTCYGLGSCIGLFVMDRLSGLSGGAHIPLPYAVETKEFLDAENLIHTMLESFCRLGSDLSCLRAKVAGGAQIFPSSQGVGPKNAEVVLHQLTMRKIFLAAADVGGAVSRTVRFNSVTSELLISTSEQKIYSI